MVCLVPMNETELEAHLEKSIPEYAADNVAAGYWSEDEALERSRKAFNDLLPQGIKTENNYLFRIQLKENGEKIGTIWMKHEAPRPHGFHLRHCVGRGTAGKGIWEADDVGAGSVCKGIEVEDNRSACVR